MSWVLVIVSLYSGSIHVHHIPVQTEDACLKAVVSVAAMAERFVSDPFNYSFCLDTETGTVVG